MESTSPDQKVAILANPYSGARGNREAVEQLQDELTGRGIHSDVFWDSAEAAERLASPQFGDEHRCVVAAGGDGTLHHLVNAQPTVPVAMLPLGTENLFAREFGHSREPARMAEMIARGRTRTIDLGDADGQRFALMVSCGYDAAVAHGLDRWRRHEQKLKRVKRATYLKPIVSTVLHYRFPLLELEADGQVVRGAMALVFNLRQYGFGFEFTPEARCDDGHLHWLVLQRPGRIRLASYTLSLKRGRLLRRPDVPHGRAKEIRIRAVDEPVPLQMDGEAAGTTPRHLRILPASLAVLIP